MLTSVLSVHILASQLRLITLHFLFGLVLFIFPIFIYCITQNFCMGCTKGKNCCPRGECPSADGFLWKSWLQTYKSLAMVSRCNNIMDSNV